MSRSLRLLCLSTALLATAHPAFAESRLSCGLKMLWTNHFTHVLAGSCASPGHCLAVHETGWRHLTPAKRAELLQNLFCSAGGDGKIIPPVAIRSAASDRLLATYSNGTLFDHWCLDMPASLCGGDR